MALKRQQDMMATFSMASMTDVIFLLLVFFLVTSTFVFPTAMEIDLPQSSEQTPEKPVTRVYIDSVANYYVQYAEADLTPVPLERLAEQLMLIQQQDSVGGGAIAVYADTRVPYGTVVELLNIGAVNGLKMVLATKPTANTPQPLNPIEPASTSATLEDAPTSNTTVQ